MYYSWILEEKLAVGAATPDYAMLQKVGFSAAVSLQENTEQGPLQARIPPGFEAVHVPIRDGIVGGVPTVAQIDAAVEAVRRLIENHIVYVHCFAGVGRSPSVCIAYLARYGGKNLEQAIDHVTDAHPLTGPTSAQMATVRRYLEGSGD